MSEVRIAGLTVSSYISVETSPWASATRRALLLFDQLGTSMSGRLVFLRRDVRVPPPHAPLAGSEE